MSLVGRLRGLLDRIGFAAKSPPPKTRGAITHVVILDGTMSSLEPGSETNAGMTYRLLSAGQTRDVSLMYEAGVQWRDWSDTMDVIEGRGINRAIRRAYGFIASRYRPGDRIFLFGYSRGAYAVRSLAGVIDRVGLLHSDHATVSMIRNAYRHYQFPSDGSALGEFRRLYCHERAPIEMVGVWDTVKALGFRAPILWRWSEQAHSFHDHSLGQSIRHGYHALALDETRAAYAPVLWDTTADHMANHVEQCWFRGSHGDVGGQLLGFDAARPLANIPLVWMLERAEACGLALPLGWREGMDTNPQAPSAGSWRGWGRLFWARKRRTVGRDPSERLHMTVGERRDVPDGLLLAERSI